LEPYAYAAELQKRAGRAQEALIYKGFEATGASEKRKKLPIFNSAAYA